MPFPVTASGIVARPREIFFVTIFPNTLILELLFTVYIPALLYEINLNHILHQL